jgi:hypothetical protein
LVLAKLTQEQKTAAQANDFNLNIRAHMDNTMP